ncbi:F-box/LRR-repeat protein 4-like [Actinia tenebrosa]|uniref:F-box/LRR-repeat protein 4-like n=1 Tax=Actinia tenebrosa TaxID=6105 RepID=A0A6P8HGT2_ACTTE|nr:F-box/LRR-repeat protein 4-like [Actinia tenebrosa]
MENNGKEFQADSSIVHPVRQVAQKVLDFSSQYSCNTSSSYSASNLAGQAKSYPNYGDFQTSFVLRTYGPWWTCAPSAPPKIKVVSKAKSSFISTDFVDLFYEEPVYPKKIHILETYNPGAVVRILALKEDNNQVKPIINANGGWVELWSGKPQKCPPLSRSMSPPLKRIEKPTRVIRLEFNHQHLEYYTELDAVELFGNAVTTGNLKIYQSNDVSKSCATDVATNLIEKLSITDVVTSSNNGYFDLLPNEVVHLVFMYLGFHDLTRAAATCRLFLRHCYDPVWYKELDLQPYWTVMNDVALRGLCSRCTNTEKLNLSWCGPYGAITAKGINQFLENSCRQLVCLRLSACKFVDNNVLRGISQFCPKLKELDLSSCMNATDEGFVNLKALKKLKRLNLYRVNITDDSLIHILRSSNDLEHLNIGASIQIVRCNEIIYCLTANCRNMVSLDFWRNKSLTSEGISCLAQGCPLLEELEIGWCTSIVCSTECIQKFVKGHSRLKKLFMAAIRSMDSQIIDAVAEHCPHMEQLDILGTSLVDQAVIKKLTANCTKLKFLDVSFCSQLKTDFIQELRTAYPKISIKKSFVSADA